METRGLNHQQQCKRSMVIRGLNHHRLPPRLTETHGRSHQQQPKRSMAILGRSLRSLNAWLEGSIV
jgi:hypothetical protein